MFDMNMMMGKMREMQEKMRVAQENLDKITVVGESGAGMVKVTVNGKRKVLKVEVDKDVFKEEDKDLIQDLIVAATNKGLEEAEIKAKEEMQKQTEGMLPNIPGMDFSGMF